MMSTAWEALDIGEHLRGGEVEVPGVLQLITLDRLAEPVRTELVAAGNRGGGGRHAVAGAGHRRAEQLRESALERRERGVDQLDVIELQRHVVAVGHLALYRSAGRLDL